VPMLYLALGITSLHSDGPSGMRVSDLASTQHCITSYGIAYLIYPTVAGPLGPSDCTTGQGHFRNRILSSLSKVHLIDDREPHAPLASW